MYSVSSAFLAKAALHNAQWLRRMYIGASDYTGYVAKWPTISKKWDDLRTQTVSIELSNEDKTFNFLSADPKLMRSTCSLKLGFAHVGSEEFITVFAGTIDAARFQGGGCNMTLVDKFRRLADRKIGDNSSAVSYTASNYLVHNMAWYACTSLGGLSAIASTSNPDIDYQSFSSWTSAFSADNVRVQAELTGQQPIEILRKLARLTQSAIYVENNRIKFTRFTIAGSGYYTLDETEIVDAAASLDDRELVNKSWVSAAYDVSSRMFGLTVFQQSSDSQANYGLSEELISENAVWLVDSVSALNLAQRIINSQSEIKNKYHIKTALQALPATIGDTILFQDALLEVSDTFRIMGESLNMDTGEKTFDIDQTQYYGSFILDVSLLDGTDILA